jgi:predicted outer membrane lipoprotein
MSDDQDETASGGFSKARSHIMLILGLSVAAAISIWLEHLDAGACRPVETTRPVAAGINPA